MRGAPEDPGTAPVRTEWTIQEVVRHTGVTSRTLRHYDAIGLLPASAVGHGGVRRYDDDALVRLQRILLLRDLGLSLPAIRDVLADRPGAETSHLHTHLELLRVEREALDRRIAAITRTIRAREKGTTMTDETKRAMFDGFDHTQYEEEVTRRWGRAAYASSDAWWRGLSTQERQAFQEEVAQLGSDWVAAAREGEQPDGERAQALAARHVRWLTSAPGTSAATGDRAATAGYVLGLAETYVADDRFRANYTGDSLDDVPHGPELVRDALTIYAERELG